jgi:hypothetical protein
MLWGSNSAFARALGKTHSTTDKWLRKGRIPPDEEANVIAAAKRDHKRLAHDAFVDKRLFRETPAAPPVENVAAA